MTELLKLSAGAVTAALCALVVKKEARELSLVLSLTASALILGAAFSGLSALGGFFSTLAETAGLAPALFSPVLKTVGISIVTRLTAALCRDAGESGIAAAVELAGATAGLALAVPLLNALLRTLEGLV